MKSIMHNKDEGTCYLCAMLNDDYARRTGLHKHHVVFGTANRKLSEKYGLTVYLCYEHHEDPSSGEAVHHNAEINNMLREQAQRAFERRFPDKSFREIFGKNYIGDEVSS